MESSLVAMDISEVCANIYGSFDHFTTPEKCFLFG